MSTQVENFGFIKLSHLRCVLKAFIIYIIYAIYKFNMKSHFTFILMLLLKRSQSNPMSSTNLLCLYNVLLNFDDTLVCVQYLIKML